MEMNAILVFFLVFISIMLFVISENVKDINKTINIMDTTLDEIIKDLHDIEKILHKNRKEK